MLGQQSYEMAHQTRLTIEMDIYSENDFMFLFLLSDVHFDEGNMTLNIVKPNTILTKSIN